MHWQIRLGPTFQAIRLRRIDSLRPYPSRDIGSSGEPPCQSKSPNRLRAFRGTNHLVPYLNFVYHGLETSCSLSYPSLQFLLQISRAALQSTCFPRFQTCLKGFMAPQRPPELFYSKYSGFKLLLPLRTRGSNGISFTPLQAQVQAQVQPSSKRSNASTEAQTEVRPGLSV
jgi:hypothetical protein